MTKSLFLLLIGSILFAYPLTAANRATVDDISFMTEEYPPYSFTSGGELKGFAVDIMVLMLAKLRAKKTRADIQVVPWARGYKTVSTKPNVCLFAMTWTKDRSQLFKFVGPLEKFDSASLFARKDRKIRVKSYDDLKNYKIGVLRDDIGQDNLREQGVTNLVEVAAPEFSAKMLATGRVDLWAYGEESVPIIFKKFGIDPNEFENVFRLDTGDSYYAFSRETPDELIQKFQNAYDELRKEKKIQPVVDSYLKKL